MMNAQLAPCAHEKGSTSRCDRGVHCTQEQYLNEKLVKIQERRAPPPPDPRSGVLSTRDQKKYSCRQLNVNQKASVKRRKGFVHQHKNRLMRASQETTPIYKGLCDLVICLFLNCVT